MSEHFSKAFLHFLQCFPSINPLIIATHIQLKYHYALYNGEKWGSKTEEKETVFRVTKASSSPGGIQVSACTIADFLASVPLLR